MRRLLPGEQPHDWIDPSAHVSLVERVLPADWAGKKLACLNEPGRFLLTAVTRLGEAQIVCPTLVGQEGDVLHFVVDVDAFDALRERLDHGPEHRCASRSPAPATSVSSSPTTSSPPGTRCCSSSRTRPWSSAAVADEGVEWFIADACEVTSLKEAGLERCDVVVAATGDDEDNLVVSLLAKQEFAVPRVIARVNHPKNEWMFNENWGVDLSVSTPHLITALVEEAVTVGRLVRLFTFRQGGANLVELTLPATSPLAGHRGRQHPPGPRTPPSWRSCGTGGSSPRPPTTPSSPATSCSSSPPPSPSPSCKKSWLPRNDPPATAGPWARRRHRPPPRPLRAAPGGSSAGSPRWPRR